MNKYDFQKISFYKYRCYNSHLCKSVQTLNFSSKILEKTYENKMCILRKMMKFYATCAMSNIALPHKTVK